MGTSDTLLEKMIAERMGRKGNQPKEESKQKKKKKVVKQPEELESDDNTDTKAHGVTINIIVPNSRDDLQRGDSSDDKNSIINRPGKGILHKLKKKQDDRD
jgi:hypothetical protein